MYFIIENFHFSLTAQHAIYPKPASQQQTKLVILLLPVISSKLLLCDLLAF